jgi:hypothetical protein
MFPSTHDITPSNIDAVMPFLQRTLADGNEILIVTKPNFHCIRRICDALGNQRSQLLFRFTIGSVDDSVLSFWEPGASDFSERLLSIQYSFFNGFRTSVSCEPMLDANPELLADMLLPYVTDSLWFGKPNFLIRRISRNGYSNDATYRAAMELQKTFTDDFIESLYNRFASHPKIKWKDSIKKVLSIETPESVGLDI